MKQPRHPLQPNLQGRLSGSLRSLQSHLERLEKLTQLVNPLLPTAGSWKVASFEQGVLCLATDQHTTASQMRYMQLQYIERLSAIPELQGLHRIKVIVEIQPKPRSAVHDRLPPLTEGTKQLLDEAASLFDDPELSQALKRLASKN